MSNQPPDLATEVVPRPYDNPYGLLRGTLVYAVSPRGISASHPGQYAAVIVPGLIPGEPDRLMTSFGAFQCADFPCQNVTRFHLAPWLQRLYLELQFRFGGPAEYQHRMEDIANKVFIQALADGRFDDRPDDMIECAKILLDIARTKFERHY